MFKFFRKKKKETPPENPVKISYGPPLKIRTWNASYFVPLNEIEKVDRDMVVDHMAEQMMEDLRADIEITSAMDPDRHGYVFRGRLRILKEE